MAPGTPVRATPSRPQAREWAMVLEAAGIPHRLVERDDGWELIVPPDDVALALGLLDAHDDREENDDEPAGDAAAAPERPMTIAGVVVALGLVGFFAITGPRAGGSAWFARGSADATRLLAGEWWRAVTALTLHADVQHLVGNAVAGALLMTAVIRQLGPGVGLGLLLLAGAGGNVLAALGRAGHTSVGASTAIFGALGVLAALRILSAGRQAGKWWVVVAASLLLLVFLGTAPEADLVAHAAGLLVGGALGALAALTLRRPPPAAVQWLLVTAAAAAVVGAWRLAL